LGTATTCHFPIVHNVERSQAKTSTRGATLGLYSILRLSGFESRSLQLPLCIVSQFAVQFVQLWLRIQMERHIPNRAAAINANIATIWRPRGRSAMEKNGSRLCKLCCGQCVARMMDDVFQYLRRWTVRQVSPSANCALPKKEVLQRRGPTSPTDQSSSGLPTAWLIAHDAAKRVST
jgi:hypothetical protein